MIGTEKKKERFFVEMCTTSLQRDPEDLHLAQSELRKPLSVIADKDLVAEELQ